MIRLQDYIKSYDNIIDEELCKNIIKESFNEFDKASIITPDDYHKDYRKAYTKVLSDEFYKDLYKIFDKIIKLYSQEFKNFSTGLTLENTGFNHILYKGDENGEYKEHVDHIDIAPRVVSCSVILNDDYEGGDFAFFGGEHIIKRKARSAVMFPSNFCYPHAITPVNKGDRHVILTWFH